MSNRREENACVCLSPSSLHIDTQLSNHGLKSKSRSFWNPDWTIQKETSITIDQTTINSPPSDHKKIQIFLGFLITILFIISVIVPFLISTVDPPWHYTKTRKLTPKEIQLNWSNGKINDSSCENLTNIENLNLNANDLLPIFGLTSFQCCLYCKNVSSCQEFLYETNSSICYLKTVTQKY